MEKALKGGQSRRPIERTTIYCEIEGGLPHKRCKAFKQVETGDEIQISMDGGENQEVIVSLSPLLISWQPNEKTTKATLQMRNKTQCISHRNFVSEVEGSVSTLTSFFGRLFVYMCD